MSDWFRISMETPDDGAGGGADTIEEPAPRASAFSPEGWTGDVPAADEVVDEPDVGAADETGEPADTPEDTPAVAERPEGWSDDDWAGFQRQFPGGSPADLWKHYTNLRTRFSQGERGEAQPTLTPEPEPEAPPSWLAHQFQSLGPIPTDGLSVQQRNELGELMQIDPKAAALWAVANSELLTEDEFSAVQNTWAQADPWGSRRYWDQAAEQVRQEQMAERLDPRLSVIDDQQQVLGRDLAFQEFPLIEEHRQEFGQWIESNPQLDEQLSQMTDPAQIKSALVTLFNTWYAPRALTELQAAREENAARVAQEQADAEAAQAAIEKQQRGARTATRSAPAAPSGGEASPDDIRAAIRGAR